MKSKILAAAILAALAQGAFAQSSVTLYGVLDDGMTYLSNVNGKKVIQMESGNLWGPVFGMKGAEDLGDGLKAIFQIEGGFDINSGRSGQGGLTFGHNTYVGLDSDKVGQVTLGRQTDSMSDVLGNYSSCYLYGGSGFHFNDNDNVCQAVRFSNAVKYVSPTVGGVTGYAMLALGNQAQFSENRTYAFALNYSHGPLAVGAAYMSVNNPGNANGPFDSKGVSTAFSDPSADNYDGFMSGNYILLQDAQKWTVAGIGASYTVGKAVLTAEYTNSKYQNSAYLSDIGGSSQPLTNVIFNNYEVGALYNFTPAFSMNLGYTLSTLRLSAVSRQTDFHIIQALADYHFSKRTDLYYLVNYQIAAGDGTYFNGTGFTQAASVQGVATVNHQLSTSVGIRHLF